MSVLVLLVFIALAGLLVWAVEKLIPMEGEIKRIFEAVVVVVVALVVAGWLLGVLGVHTPLENIKIF